MKQISQESTFSDVHLEDPDRRRSSNPGLFPDCDACFFFFSFSCYCQLADGSLCFCAIIAGNVEAASLQTSISPADLHGMWYPTVRRTLVCLSKLYRCIDVSIQYFFVSNLWAPILKFGGCDIEFPTFAFLILVYL